MANLDEVGGYPAGIYQIETTDPVVGGVPDELTKAGLANIPSQQLAKRTAFLKELVDSAGVGATVAPSITDFNVVSKSGLYQAASAANAPQGSASFTLLHTQSSATQATQLACRIGNDRMFGRRLSGGVWQSWFEVLTSATAAAALGITAAQFDSGLALATTAFVQRAIGNHSAFVEITTNVTLTAADAGKVFFIKAAVTVTLPASTSLGSGSTFKFVLSSGASLTFAGGSPRVTPFGLIHSGAISGFDVILHAVGATDQYRLELIGDGPHSLNASGYQRLPSGLIIQWGVAATLLGGGASITFPVAFPNVALSISGNLINVPPGANAVFFSFYSLSSATFGAYARNDNNTNYLAAPFSYIAIGN
jgi:hypothetical protein